MKKGMIAVVIALLCAALAVPVLAFGMGGAPARQQDQSQLMATCVDQACDIVATQAADTASDVAPVAVPSAPAASPAACHGFVDADGDGVCDNHGWAGCYHEGHHGYVDDDGDGVCDNYAQGNCASGYHHGNGAASSGGNCPAYTDADGDGTCDNYVDRGQRRGHHGGHGAHHR